MLSGFAFNPSSVSHPTSQFHTQTETVKYAPLQRLALLASLPVTPLRCVPHKTTRLKRLPTSSQKLLRATVRTCFSSAFFPLCILQGPQMEASACMESGLGSVKLCSPFPCLIMQQSGDNLSVRTLFIINEQKCMW